MSQEEFLKSLSPEQTDAFVAIRDALMAANASQNSELAIAKQAEVDAANAIRDAANSDRDKALASSQQSALDRDAALEAQKTAFSARDSVAATLQSVRALLAQKDDEINAAITDSQKTAAQKQQEEIAAQIQQLQAQQAELAKG